MENGQEYLDFDDMEHRPGGGGAGVVGWLLLVVFLVGIPIGYLIWSPRSSSRLAPQPAAAIVPSQEQISPPLVNPWEAEAPIRSGGAYTLFSDRPDWNRLRFQFSIPERAEQECRAFANLFTSLTICGPHDRTII